MKKNIKNIILVVAVLVLLIGGIREAFFKEKTTETELQKNDKEITLKGTPPAENIINVNPKSVSYAIPKRMILDKNLPIYKINNQNLNNVLVDKIAKSFGFKNKPAVSEENLVIYNNQEDNTRLDINKQTLTVRFSKNLLVNPMIKSIRVISVEEITEKLRGLMVNNFNLGQEVKIKVEKTEYEELAGPRFVVSTKEKGNIVKITANYEIFGFPVFSSTGFPIIARFSTGGNLLNLSVDLPFSNVVKQADFLVKTEDELRVAPVEDYKIINLDGGREYDLASKEEAVGGVSITSGFIGYAYTPENNYLAPWVFFKGDSKLETGAAAIVLAVPAIKEKGYYK